MLSNQKGLSLLEVLVSVVILSVGIIAVYQPMLRNITVLYDAEHRVIANRVSQNEIWKVQEWAQRFKKIPDQASQIITDHNKVFTQSFVFMLAPGEDKLYIAKAITSWRSGSKVKQIQRKVYVSTF
jgi:prepilin-type N-terminal cleavage/methylation domain-containing protein